jgi:sialate O-acetylesterase
MSEAMIDDDAAMTAQLKENGGFENIAALQAAHAKATEDHKAAVVKAKAEGKKPPRFSGPKLPGDLYKRFIEPKAPYGIRGVLWDQGESKVQIPGVDQYTAMNALITGWRKVWGQGDFPFLHVQKPSGNGCAFDPANPINKGAKPFSPTLPGAHTTKPASLTYQLDHIRIGTLKNAPLVTAVDLGTGIHPACKSGYGERAARVALGFTYGKDVAISGPVYQSHTVANGKIRVKFDHVGKGLTARHADEIQGFAIAGEDGKWTWAKAAIDGDDIVVSSPDVAAPVHVQYAFSKDQSYANLFSKDGLPALMFTTVQGR